MMPTPGSLEDFAARGLRAQTAVDEIIAKEATASRLRAIIVEHLGVAPADVVTDVLLVDHEDGRSNLGGDSLDIVELSMAAEEEFNIDILDEDITPLNAATFGELVDFIHARLPEQRP